MKNIDISQIKVPVTGNEGTHLESFNPKGKQSDGSMWSIPKPLTAPDHRHYFILNPIDREARCECGFGGRIYPHNARIENGHIYKLDGTKVI